MRSLLAVARRWAVTASRLLCLVAVAFALLEARRILGSDRPFGWPELANEMRRLVQILGVSFAVLGPVAALDTGLRLRQGGSVWMLAQSSRGLDSLVAAGVACGAVTCAAVWMGSLVGPHPTRVQAITRVGAEWVWQPWLDVAALALPADSFELPMVDSPDIAASADDPGTRIGNAHWLAGAAVLAALLRGVTSAQRSTWQSHASFVNWIAATVALWAWAPRFAFALVAGLSLAQLFTIRVRGVRAS